MAPVYETGLVLHLYPPELLRFGATHTADADEAATAEHFFLCLSADAREGLWIPMYVTRRQDRTAIPEQGKTGQAHWTRGPSYYAPGELWRIPHKAIQRTLASKGDRPNTPYNNRVAVRWIPARSEFPALPT